MLSEECDLPQYLDATTKLKLVALAAHACRQQTSRSHRVSAVDPPALSIAADGWRAGIPQSALELIGRRGPEHCRLMFSRIRRQPFEFELRSPPAVFGDTSGCFGSLPRAAVLMGMECSPQPRAFRLMSVPEKGVAAVGFMSWNLRSCIYEKRIARTLFGQDMICS